MNGQTGVVNGQTGVVVDEIDIVEDQTGVMNGQTGVVNGQTGVLNGQTEEDNDKTVKRNKTHSSGFLGNITRLFMRKKKKSLKQKKNGVLFSGRSEPILIGITKKYSFFTP